MQTLDKIPYGTLTSPGDLQQIHLSLDLCLLVPRRNLVKAIEARQLVGKIIDLNYGYFSQERYVFERCLTEEQRTWRDQRRRTLHNHWLPDQEVFG